MMLSCILKDNCMFENSSTSMKNKSQTINKRPNPFPSVAFVSADPESCQKSRKAVKHAH